MVTSEYARRQRRSALGLIAIPWILLSASAGYWFSGTSGSVDGAVIGFGLYVGYLGILRWMRSEEPNRLLGARRRPDEDWKRLLDHEKCSYARQLERDGFTDEARTVYEYLVHIAYPNPVPYERLARMHRRAGRDADELAVLEKAHADLDSVSDGRVHTAPGRIPALRRRRRELRALSSSSDTP